MDESSLKSKLTEDMKRAMKSGDKRRLGTIRLVLSEIKQREVDERIQLQDTDVLAILGKMRKQRQDSMQQYRDASRADLADQEAFEIAVIEEYLPEALDATAVQAIVEEVIAACGATSMKDMGKVMGQLKAKLQGRADLGQIGAIVKQRLA